jgi:hypothetical protein
MNSSFTPKLKFILAITAIAALSRLLPHEYNFSPIGAIALFAGTYITNKRLALILPLTILFISDLLLELFTGNGFYPDMGFVYGAFALVACLGFFLRNHENVQTILATSLVASVIFFLVTNFGTWMVMSIYPKTGAGLLECYAAGIPFIKGTIMGDLFYNFVFFSAYALAKWRFPVLVKG